MGSIVRSRKVEGKEAKTRKQLQKCRQFDGTFVHVKQFSNWFYFRIWGKNRFFQCIFRGVLDLEMQSPSGVPKDA